MDPAIFFPTRGAPLDEARAVCARCPVRADCLDYAMETGQKFGIWGGLSERERRARRTTLHRAKTQGPVVHGTRTMFLRHKNAPDAWGPPCDECRAAERAYNSAIRRKYRTAEREERARDRARIGL
jgi:WhiB family redox-sensing transcriptional regulator